MRSNVTPLRPVETDDSDCLSDEAADQRLACLDEREREIFQYTLAHSLSFPEDGLPRIYAQAAFLFEMTVDDVKTTLSRAKSKLVHPAHTQPQRSLVAVPNPNSNPEPSPVAS